MSAEYDRLRKYLNPKLKGKFWDALLNALAEGDALNEKNILAAKDNLFVATAQAQYLEKLMASMGVVKPIGMGIDDDSFRELGIKQTNAKQITNIFLDIYETFYGSEAVRASSISGLPESYQLYDGMTLELLVDTSTTPLIITFNEDEFENIASATANEIAAIITRQAFNLGYVVYAEAYTDYSDGLTYVRITSGTRGPKSSITVVGGNAQDVLRFDMITNSTPRVGTQFTPSFVGQYVRFTWTAGPDPQLTYTDPGSYVTMYGSDILEENQGSFRVENIAGGGIGESYFEIINPNFQIQGPITLSTVPGASGGGEAVYSLDIVSSPIGLVRSSNVITITTVIPHNLAPGDTISIIGAEKNSFNGTYTILTAAGNTMTVSQAGPDDTSGGGTAQAIVSIEDSPLGAVRAAGVATVTFTTNHPFTVGETITIRGVTDSSFNVSAPIISATANSISYAQDISNDILFFTPVKNNLQRLARYATVYEVNPYEIVVFLPATASIIRRGLTRAWHLNPSVEGSLFKGSYLYNPKSGYTITKTSTLLTEDIAAGQVKTVIFGQNTSQFPDAEGSLVFERGTSNEEGPVKYFGRSSNGSLLLDPSYKFKKNHDAGADIATIYQVTPYSPKIDGSDYQPYVTGTVPGRVEAINLTNQLVASGISVNVVIVYPGGPGLSSVEDVYGEDIT